MSSSFQLPLQVWRRLDFCRCFRQLAQGCSMTFLAQLSRQPDRLLARPMGPNFISPKDKEGLVAFPSNHTIIAILAMYSARTTRLWVPILVVVNLFVLPGLLIHGGHHLIDGFGGLLTAWRIIFVVSHVGTGKEIQADGVFVAPEHEITFVKSPSSISGLHS